MLAAAAGSLSAGHRLVADRQGPPWHAPPFRRRQRWPLPLVDAIGRREPAVGASHPAQGRPLVLPASRREPARPAPRRLGCRSRPARRRRLHPNHAGRPPPLAARNPPRHRQTRPNRPCHPTRTPLLESPNPRGLFQPRPLWRQCRGRGCRRVVVVRSQPGHHHPARGHCPQRDPPKPRHAPPRPPARCRPPCHRPSPLGRIVRATNRAAPGSLGGDLHPHPARPAAPRRPAPVPAVDERQHRPRTHQHPRPRDAARVGTRHHPPPPTHQRDRHRQRLRHPRPRPDPRGPRLRGFRRLCRPRHPRHGRWAPGPPLARVRLETVRLWASPRPGPDPPLFAARRWPDGFQRLQSGKFRTGIHGSHPCPRCAGPQPQHPRRGPRQPPPRWRTLSVAETRRGPPNQTRRLLRPVPRARRLRDFTHPTRRPLRCSRRRRPSPPARVLPSPGGGPT